MMEGWYALVAFATAWLIAQVSKTVIGFSKHRRKKEIVNFGTAVNYFTRSGGMPSGHTASLTAACIYLGCALGFDSGLFALAVCVWMIVVYDAIHVRYAVGIQGEALNGLLKQAGKAELPIFEGHTLPQVAVGALIGIAVGLVIFGAVNGF